MMTHTVIPIATRGGGAEGRKAQDVEGDGPGDGGKGWVCRVTKVSVVDSV